MKQHIHILGICGTFMGSLAQLAQAAGFKVTGCDAGVYPPMSHQLEQAGIELTQGFEAEQISNNADLYVIGNVISRGNPLIEAILDAGLPYISGPQWLAENILPGKWVLGVAGTHGKTTTTSMLAWILEFAGFKPGFLIGGVPTNFGVSAKLGETDFFVVEADEYDTAFFDKRSKFVHYRPRTLIINNLEFDHADIFENLDAIQRQFHHLVRTVPANGLVLYPERAESIAEVLAQGCWSERQSSGVEEGNWRALFQDGGFEVVFEGRHLASVHWDLLGEHNVQNALHAIAAARHIGIDPELSVKALNEFKGVKRRMELIGEHRTVRVYDDFAHHPTAIKSTLAGLRASVGASAEIVAVIEPRSNTMKLGTHKNSLDQSVADADRVYWYEDGRSEWSLKDLLARDNLRSQVFTDHQGLIEQVLKGLKPNTHIVVMSNGGFENMPRRLFNSIVAL